MHFVGSPSSLFIGIDPVQTGYIAYLSAVVIPLTVHNPGFCSHRPHQFALGP